MAKQKRQQQPRHFDTPQAVMTSQQLARIRTAARQYLLAGGSITVAPNDTGLNEHIANVRELLQPGVDDAFDDLLKTHVPDYDAHEATWSAAWHLVATEGEAGFAFGVAVGCEVAALTIGQPATIPTVRTPRTRKGGTQ